MPLSPGTRLGVYEIVDALGAGGMGEVYRARDTKLRRDVAIKVLPEALSLDPDRIARFQREAELLASLNHPNIAAIYGLEESDGASAIIMELVEGETLAEKLPGRKGSGLPIDEAIPIARQIVDALEAAHERGVVHRDLKPANIKIAPDGKVKVLDFGLAKAMEAGASGAGRSGGVGGLSMSPTLSVHATYAGVILGTAAYMSPEQARGKPVDRRADIWAFGCVLFEMLAGKQAFEGGETVSDAIAAILRAEIDWTALPADTPAHVLSLLRRCLQKDPQKRLPHIGVVRLELDEPPIVASAAVDPTAQPGFAPKPLWKRAMPAAVAAVVVGALGVAAWMLKQPPASSIARFQLTLGDGQIFSSQSRRLVAISPDGTQMAYTANQRLYLRSITDVDARPIPGTEPGANVLDPVFSPDSRSIAFVTAGGDRAIKRVSVSGGAPITLCPLDAITVGGRPEQQGSPFGMSWDADGIIFALNGKGILRVSANGGKPEVLVVAGADEQIHNPSMLPDGHTLLFTVAAIGGADTAWEKARVVTHSLTSGQRKTVIDGGASGRYVPTGHIVYVLRGVLFAVPFDLRRQEVTGGPVPLVEGLRTDGGTAHFSFSANGSLIYVPGAAGLAAGGQDLAFIDRKGTTEPLKLPDGQYDTPRASPDGKRVAFGVDDGKEQMIWIYDLSGTSSMRRLTFGGKNRFPVWSADGRRIAFQSDREGDAAIFWQSADGTDTAERLTKPEKDTAHVPESWSPGGEQFLFSATKDLKVSLWAFALRDKKATPFGGVQSRYPTAATFSPDGRWVAYQSSESGSTQLYMQPVPTTGTKYQLTKTSSAHYPMWSPDGKELVFIPGRQQFAVMSITTRPAFAFSNAAPLPRAGLLEGGPQVVRTIDIARDGRVLTVVNAGQLQTGAPIAQRIQVVLNWFEDVKQRVPNR
jgi:serine/threonine-protein kinase